MVEPLADHLVGEFGDLPAFVADREGGHAVAVVVRLGAGDEGIEAFQPVHEAGLHQRVERAIDLQRRAKAMLAQLVEQRVGAERRRWPPRAFPAPAAGSW